ncbi:hypothetical protein GGTG_03923 [Gaeumannomyces tritici R3-111a-1]|uniref:Uncharacterized protein n=1 Tax=Gaeumannomyces tritici (strain R3-111a-1) TaxID=644352 RepID=J3NRM1_GAET3|nr:hypothetical protein GGTG_03923 [Gaeumannomyces tritici R3-111a-1]EJT78827.1 hypothetical protein GGTG_03923 [Gaeumannomyces tritici R3-111a-1]
MLADVPGGAFVLASCPVSGIEPFDELALSQAATSDAATQPSNTSCDPYELAELLRPSIPVHVGRVRVSPYRQEARREFPRRRGTPGPGGPRIEGAAAGLSALSLIHRALAY